MAPALTGILTLCLCPTPSHGQIRLLPSSQTPWSLSLRAQCQLFCKCATVPALGRDLSLSFPVSLQGQALVSALVTLGSALRVDIDLRALPQLEKGGERFSSGQAAVPLERDSSLQTSGRPFCPEDLQYPALAEECPGSSVDLAGGKQRPAFSVSVNPPNIPKNKGLSL